MDRLSRTPVVAFSGPSGVGKTTLLVKLVAALVRRGLVVAALKHSGHPHPFDRRGKDSERLRRAGALAVALQGPAGMAYFGPPAPDLAALLATLPPADLIVAEGFKAGFKAHPMPRVEVHRRAVSREFQCVRDRHVIAVVTDEPPPRDLPCFTPGEVEPLADFLCARFTRRVASGPPALARPRARDHRSGEKASARRAPEKKRMAKTTTKSGSRRGSSRSKSTSKGSRSRSTAKKTGRRTTSRRGKSGGEATLRARGREFYSEIGRKGGKASGGRRSTGSRSRRSSSSRTKSSGTRGSSRRSGGSSRRGGSKSRSR